MHRKTSPPTKKQPSSRRAKTVDTGSAPPPRTRGRGPRPPPSKLLAGILENIETGVCVWDADLHLVTWNAAYRAIHAIPDEFLRPGTRLATILDHSLRLRDDPRTGEELEALTRRRLVADGRLELDRVLADGRTISVNYHGFLSGGWIAFYQDVTDRRQDVQRLKESERDLKLQNIRFEAAVTNMAHGLCMFDKDQRLVICNARYAEMYALPPELVAPGTSHWDILHYRLKHGMQPTGGITTEAFLERHAAEIGERKGKTQTFELSTGRVITITHQPMSDGGWVATHQDITEERERMRVLQHREAELEAQNSRFDAALNSMHYGFCLWDADFRLIVCNERVAEIYDLAPHALTPGMSLRDFFMASVEAENHPGRTTAELLALYRTRLEGLAADQTAVTEEVLANGRTIEVIHRRNAAKNVWIATHEDVTEEKDRLNTLQQREVELERQNMRFTAAVNNMSQGLCMFDSEQKLVICNKRYADIYRLPAELVRPGTLLTEILEYRITNGIYPVVGAQAYVDRRLQLVTDRQHAVDIVELQDGRVISVLHHPMSDGGWVSTHQDITDQRRTEERIRHLARHDSLTDLPNRVLFRERMDAVIPRIKRGETMAVLCIDLDHFKAVNDTLGHAVGDSLLRAVADRLIHACREDDLVARFGGDEFTILHGPLDNVASASALADRIVRAMAEPFDVHDHQVVIGASVGIAVGPDDSNDTDGLLKAADLALYRAKAEGRGAYHFFEKSMDAALQRRLALEVGLRRALSNGELNLAFQPLFSLEENRICGVEALLRWDHPERGVVMPDEIIPVAEETGLIVPIGEWVLRQACMAAAQWPDDVRIAVNLSPIQFKNRNLAQHVVSALAAAGVKPDRLELEITESVLLAENELAVKTLHQLRGLGVRISMDDFGTGYSSLSYLRSFPFDRIKIDQSFVRDLASREDSLAIVKAVIGLGRSLGISTTAEGVETEDQLDLVREQGCTEVQGFLFSRPLSRAAIDELLPKRQEAPAELPRFKTAS